MSAPAHLHVRDLDVFLGATEILHGVNLTLPAGQITGLAGESGSGKSMTALAILGLLPDRARLGGHIDLDGQNLLTLPPRQLAAIRGKTIAMIFQDPAGSFHPLLSIGTQLTDHVRHHLGLTRAAARSRAAELLDRVRVPEPAAALGKYPHQFSGGQLQRIAIASAIACQPRVLLADEPTTALDVTVQAEILRLLRELSTELGLATLLITHDLAVISSVATTVTIMQTGRVVEAGDRFQILTQPQHPYTRSLIDALPSRWHVRPEEDHGD